MYFISANVLSSEVEEARLLLDTAERARKHAEVEVTDIREAIASIRDKLTLRHCSMITLQTWVPHSGLS